MSTPIVQEAAPGTPGTAVTPAITPTAKAMTAAAYGEAAPVETKPVMPPLPGKKIEPAKAADPSKAAEAPPIKTTEAAPAKAAEVKVELPEDKLDIPANASPEAVKNFKAYKESMKGILAAERERVSKAEKAVADAQAVLDARTQVTPAATADLAAKEARLKAAEDRLAVLDLQNHPDFVRQFTQPKEKALATAKEVLDYNEKAGVELGSLLGKSMKDFNAAISEMTKDMNSADAATVATSLREARALQANEAQALTQSSELRTALQAKAAQEQKQAFEEVSKGVDGILTIKELPEGLSAEEKTEVLAYNDAVRGLRANAEKKVFGRVSEREVAGLAFKAETYDLMAAHVIPGMIKTAKARDSLIADLTAKINSLSGNRSPASGAGDAGGGGDKPKTRQEMLTAAYGKENV